MVPHSLFGQVLPHFPQFITGHFLKIQMDKKVCLQEHGDFGYKDLLKWEFCKRTIKMITTMYVDQCDPEKENVLFGHVCQKKALPIAH